jgi:predicted TIM-barrel fold metal-dependent hydrolase
MTENRKLPAQQPSTTMIETMELNSVKGVAAQAVGRVDAHHHVFEQARFPQTWIDETMDAINGDFGTVELYPEVAAAGVSQTVLVQTVASIMETEHLLDIALRQQPIAGVVGWADLEDPALEATIALYRNRPGGQHLVGLRFGVQAEIDQSFLDRPSVRGGLATVARAGLVFDLLITARHWDAAVRVVRDLPMVQFVLDHLGKPTLTEGAELSRWETMMRTLAEHDNVSAKLSGLVTEASWNSWTPDDLRPAVELALEAFGPNRLMFGSDWPVCRLASGYQHWVATAEDLLATTSPAESVEIFGGTARRIYGFGPQ